MGSAWKRNAFTHLTRLIVLKHLEDIAADLRIVRVR